MRSQPGVHGKVAAESKPAHFVVCLVVEEDSTRVNWHGVMLVDVVAVPYEGDTVARVTIRTAIEHELMVFRRSPREGTRVGIGVQVVTRLTDTSTVVNSDVHLSILLAHRAVKLRWSITRFTTHVAFIDATRWTHGVRELHVPVTREALVFPGSCAGCAVRMTDGSAVA